MTLKATLTVFFVLSCWTAYSQSKEHCPAYDTCIKRAKFWFGKGKYEEARKEYYTAKVFAKECNINDSLTNKGINYIIKAYEKQAQKAEKARKKAADQENIIRNVLDESQAYIKMGMEIAERYNDTKGKQKFDSVKNAADTKIVSLYAAKKVTNSDVASQVKNDKQTGGKEKINTHRYKYFLKTMKFVYDNKVRTGVPDINSTLDCIFDRLDKDIGFNTVAEHLRDSSMSALEKLAPSTHEYNLMIFAYLKAAMYSSWHWTEEGHKDLAISKNILNKADSFLKRLPYRSALVWYGMAGLYNGYYNYYTEVSDNSRALTAIKSALEYSMNAVKANPTNIRYQRYFAILLRNASSLGGILSPLAQIELARSSYKCMSNMCNASSYIKNNSKEFYNSSSSLTDILLSAGYIHQAIDTLDNTINTIDSYEMHSHNKAKVEEIEVYRLNLTIKKSSVLLDYLHDYNAGLKSLNDAYALINSNHQDSTDNMDIDRFVDLNTSTNNLLKYAQTRRDSINAISILSDEIYTFKNLAFANRNRFKIFFGGMDNIARPYMRKLELSILVDNIEAADSDYIALNTIFLPYYNKYPFDFYLGHVLAISYKIYANYLCKKGRYGQALPLLKFASLQGIKECTDSLISIYQKTYFNDKDSLSFYQKRTTYQSNGVRRFTIPAYLKDKKQSLDVYILDKAKEYDTNYTGIRDQVQWAKEALHYIVEEDVVSSFDKLQKIAWEYDTSYQDLCTYALSSSQQEATRDKNYYKSQISIEKDSLKKIVLYEKLISFYDSEATANHDIIRYNYINLSQEYNTLGWENILEKQFKNLISIFNKSIKLDSTNLFAQGNLAHAYLFDNQFEKAKAEYLRLKDVKIENDSRFRNMREAFLDDFKEFERLGITHPDLKKIEQLLKQ